MGNLAVTFAVEKKCLCGIASVEKLSVTDAGKEVMLPRYATTHLKPIMLITTPMWILLKGCWTTACTYTRSVQKGSVNFIRCCRTRKSTLKLTLDLRRLLFLKPRTTTYSKIFHRHFRRYSLVCIFLVCSIPIVGISMKSVS